MLTQAALQGQGVLIENTYYSAARPNKFRRATHRNYTFYFSAPQFLQH